MPERLEPREFRLSAHGNGLGVSCDGNGAFLGSIPFLKRSRVNGKNQWQPVDSRQLSNQISTVFGLPIDMAGKLGGLEVIAAALNAGQVARAQIATVLLGIPDPPPFSKAMGSTRAMMKFIRDLYWSGMIKADWEPDEHPRWPAGAPDSQGGQFAPKGEGADSVSEAGSADARLDDGVYRPDSDPVQIDPVASSPEQLKQNWQQHEDEVNRQVRWLESKGYGAIKVTKNVSFIGRNGVRVTVDYVVSRLLPDGLGGFWLEPDYGADVKTGRGGLRDSQRQVYPAIGSNTWVYPVGVNAISAGFEPQTWAYFPIVYGDALSTTEH